MNQKLLYLIRILNHQRGRLSDVSHLWILTRQLSQVNGGGANISGQTETAPRQQLMAADMRRPYRNKLSIFDFGDLVSKEPFEQFLSWFQEAKKCESILEPNAMHLATATMDGKPSARLVLMKGFSKQGVVFFTNCLSQKGGELEKNPRCSLVFYWEPFNRQVRIEGVVERTSDEEATEYFHSRPRGSQISASVSLQSSRVGNRQEMEARHKELEQKYSDPSDVIPKPDFWGGYRVVPSRFEFWQGQTDRLHDRIVFRRPQEGEVIDSSLTHTGDDGWFYERLMP